MALIECVKCGKTYSDSAVQCPHCKYEPSFFVCPECHRIYHKSEEKCPGCGFTVTDTSKLPATDEKIAEAFHQLADECLTVGSSDKGFELLERIKNFETEESTSSIYDEICQRAQETVLTLKEAEEREEAYRISKENFCHCDDIFLKMEAYHYLNTILDFKDSAEILENGKEAFFEEAYSKANEMLEHALTDEDFDKAALLFEGIKDYKDSLALKEKCISKKDEKNAKMKKQKNTKILLAAAGVAVIIAALFAYSYMNPKEAREVKKQIAALSETEITADSEEQLFTILVAYNKLDDRGKKAVKNYADLEAAYEKYYDAAAKDYDSQAQGYIDMGTDADLDSLKQLYDRYDSLDEEIQKRITTYDDLKNLLCDVVTARVCSYDVNNIDEMNSLYNDYKEFLVANNKLTDAALHVGPILVYSCVKKTLKNRLKDPNSLRVSTYTLTDPEKSKDIENQYTVTTSLNYSATNSFGAYVSGYAYGDGYFTIDTTNGNIDAHGGVRYSN